MFRELGERIVGAPSILSADFAHLAEEVERTKAGGAELVHFDVMDNHFVPNLTIGPPVAASLVRATDLPVDVHLMMDNPDNLIPAFAEAGVASISVHQEAAVHLHRTLTRIQEAGCEAGIVLNPATPPETLEWALPAADFVLVMSVNPGFGGQSFIPETPEKIRRLREMTDKPIEVDGGITAETAPLVVEAGAQVLVAGSAVFKGEPAEEMRRILDAARSAGRSR
ncbi:rpe: ribulose-phosphate 3-epimerase (plasmid) [Rubrobacter radiotolerans]|uniref:Ribulose-phosphate 3-epimerase n=1 Tax=Rubrobacter radiotolerans TaxID=42256 RepID=A0A023X7L1_RUBRA|nr:ribulose-phosphate 3-epimerase [Rubrobacter radiotolerans]AHY48323.1 rpe: ribulose-phosphate 3-epimerase [Rubrobacter radiotolerans]MDX5895459.1 ribulose-phosphate 3-epimerase [Rubrobacter radiotolerans]SMC01520.1 ribulose-5-phosphate 3-epimerase [Rubrobacter radiotolerans DSM 5868]